VELPRSMPVKRISGPPGCAGGGCGAAERGAGKGGRGGSAGAGGLPAVFAHGRSGRTPGRMWAGEKKNEPSFSGGKTKNPCVFSHLAPHASPPEPDSHDTATSAILTPSRPPSKANYLPEAPGGARRFAHLRVAGAPSRPLVPADLGCRPLTPPLPNQTHTTTWLH
jgi:hypothetical protein